MIGLMLAVACVACSALPPQWQALLEYRSTAIDEPWRLVGAHVVHWSSAHALCNAALLLPTCAMLERRLGSRTLLFLLLAGALTIDAALALGAPQMTAYRGASGLVAMLLALVVLTRVRAERRIAAAALCLVLVGLNAAAQLAGHAPSTLPPDVRSAWQAHLAGMLAALLAVAPRRMRNGRRLNPGLVRAPTRATIGAMTKS